MNSSDAEVIKALQQPDHIVIDCRGPAEFAGGDAYAGAKNIPVANIQDRLAEIGDKNRTVITYCAAGARACRAADVLRENGFTHVISTTNAGHLREVAKKVPH